MFNMKIRPVLFALPIILLLQFFTASATFAIEDSAIADPSEIGVGARPLGMGKAFVALADDGSAIYMNPAGLANFKTWKLNSMSGNILQDVNYVVIGAASPFQFGTLGVGYINVGVPGIPITTLTGGGTPEFTGDYANYNAGLFFLSYGSKLDRFVPYDLAKQISVGLSGKIFLQGFSGGGPSLESISGTGLNMDLGFLYKPTKWGTVGLNFVNVLPEGLGGKFVWPKTDTRDEPLEEKIPTVVKLGACVKFWGEDSLTPSTPQDLYVDLDVDMDTYQRPSVWHLGAEFWPVPMLALRAGVDQKPAASNMGVVIENDYTAGVGIKFSGFTFDYAYHQYGELSENTTHYFSLGFVGDEKKERKKEMIEEVVKPSATSEPVVSSTVKAKPVLKTFFDVPEGYWAKDAIEYLATLGVIGGYPDGTFRPEELLNRAEFSAILVRAKGVDPLPPASDPYPDLPAGNWAARYVKSASDMKLVSGYPDGNFNPNKTVSRSEGVVIISRFADLNTSAAVVSPFSDLSSSHWAAPAVAAAVNAGMLDYLAGKTFEPEKGLTRAEVAQMLSKTGWGKAKIKELLQG